MENMALAFSGSQEKARSFPVPESSEWEVAEKDALAIDTSGIAVDLSPLSLNCWEYKPTKRSLSLWAVSLGACLPQLQAV